MHALSYPAHRLFDACCQSQRIKVCSTICNPIAVELNQALFAQARSLSAVLVLMQNLVNSNNVNRLCLIIEPRSAMQKSIAVRTDLLYNGTKLHSR